MFFFFEHKGCAAAGSTRGGAAAHVPGAASRREFSSHGQGGGVHFVYFKALWMLCHVASPALRRGSFLDEDPSPWKGWERFWGAGEDTPSCPSGVVAMGAAKRLGKAAQGAAMGCPGVE